MSNDQKFYTPQQVSYMFDTSDVINRRVYDALALLPKEVVDFVYEKCAIVTMEEEEGNHWNLDSELFKDKTELIILNSHIWDFEWPKTALIIAHEVAHAFLGHKTRSDQGKDRPQELAADEQAVTWLSVHWEREALLKLCYYLNSK